LKEKNRKEVLTTAMESSTVDELVEVSFSLSLITKNDVNLRDIAFPA